MPSAFSAVPSSVSRSIVPPPPSSSSLFKALPPSPAVAVGLREKASKGNEEITQSQTNTPVHARSQSSPSSSSPLPSSPSSPVSSLSLSPSPAPSHSRERSGPIPLYQLKITRAIGKGFFSEVFLARYQSDWVALKLLKSPSSSPHLSSAALDRERALMEALGEHKHIVKYIGVVKNTQLNQYALITEYCPFGSVERLLHCCPLSFPLLKRLSLILDAAMGVEQIHEQNQIIHRDISARNFLCDRQRRVRLGDFGLSLSVSEASTTGATGAAALGQEFLAVRWAAVELLAGQARWSHASDTWAFGAAMWEILAGRIPFSELENYQVAYRVAALGERPAFMADWPVEIMAIMKECWDSDPKRRPPMRIVRQRIELFLNKRPREQWFHGIEDAEAAGTGGELETGMGADNSGGYDRILPEAYISYPPMDAARSSSSSPTFPSSPSPALSDYQRLVQLEQQQYNKQQLVYRSISQTQTNNNNNNSNSERARKGPGAAKDSNIPSKAPRCPDFPTLPVLVPQSPPVIRAPWIEFSCGGVSYRGRAVAEGGRPWAELKENVRKYGARQHNYVLTVAGVYIDYEGDAKKPTYYFLLPAHAAATTLARHIGLHAGRLYRSPAAFTALLGRLGADLCGALAFLGAAGIWPRAVHSRSVLVGEDGAIQVPIVGWLEEFVGAPTALGMDEQPATAGHSRSPSRGASPQPHGHGASDSSAPCSEHFLSRFLSPEAIEANALNEASLVYSVGLLLYELSNGATVAPFSGHYPNERIHQLLIDKVRAARTDKQQTSGAHSSPSSSSSSGSASSGAGEDVFFFQLMKQNFHENPYARAIPKAYESIIRACLANEANKRPSLSEVAGRLYQLAKKNNA